MELLVGGKAMEQAGSARVIVFGVGGVGSWCAESLVRSGIRHLTIVDSDRVSVSNVNRQLMATTRTVGRAKVEALRERLLEINPEAEITALQDVYTADTAERFALDGYDYIVDAIDSLSDKALLILNACRSRGRLFSSMGAALKLDPTRIRTAEFWSVKGCPLAAALRRKFRHGRQMPRKKFKCVYSDELLANLGSPSLAASRPESATDIGAENDAGSAPTGYADSKKACVNGSIVHITAIYGFTLAGMIIGDICRRAGA